MSYFKNNKQMHHVGYDRKGCGGGGGGGGWKKVFCKCLSGGGVNGMYILFIRPHEIKK